MSTLTTAFLYFSRIQARYSPPVIDSEQKLKEQSITYEDGVYSLSFKRARTETFGQDCFFFMYPIGGGSYTGSGISKHDATPVISNKAICVEQCTSPGDAEPGKNKFLSFFFFFFLFIFFF